jgi:hydrogenase-4 component E
MFFITEILLLSILLINLYLLISLRVTTAIKALALQGIILALLPLAIPGLKFNIHIIIIPIGGLLIKGIVIPRLLFKAIREVHISKDIEPYVKPALSLILGMIFIIISFWISHRLVLPMEVRSAIWVPVALASVMMGLFIIISRRKAITQVLGYLVLENGIYAFGLALAKQMPTLIEMGVLLDVFMGVFIMGIIINHIKDVFDDLDTDNLTILRD